MNPRTPIDTIANIIPSFPKMGLLANEAVVCEIIPKAGIIMI